MNTKYTIKNFRVFNEEGVSISLKPLTLLTGCNSSGKSSLVKSLLLISDYFAALKSDNANGKRIDLTAHKLDFTKAPHNSLGKFSKTVNNKSKENTITFGIQTHSEMLGQDLYIEIAFSSDDADSTNGYVKSLTIKKLDGSIIYISDTENRSIGNLYEIFDEFVRFAYTQHLICSYQSNGVARCIGKGESMSDEEYNSLGIKLKNHLKTIEQKYGRDILLDINRWNNRHKRKSFISKTIKNPDIIEGVMQSGMLYYVPFVAEKLNGNKGEVIATLKGALGELKDSAIGSIITKIITDFDSSSYDSFIEYYKNWEKSYLTNFKMWDSLRSKHPCIPDVNGIGLSANSIIMSPYNTTFEVLDDNLEFETTSKEEADKEKAKQISQWEAQPLTFEALFEALCVLSCSNLCTLSEKELKYFNTPDFQENFGYSSNTERMFLAFVEEAIKEAVLNAMPNTLSYVSSSIINVKRLYPLESSDEFTQLLKRYIEAKHNLDENLKYTPNTFLNKWVKKFHLGEKVSVNVDSEGLGVTLRLHKDEADKAGTLLADNGYGITQIFALLLNIEVCIMERTISYKDPDTYIGALSSGEKCEEVFSSPTIAIEEPEIHLHPNYQSMLAEMGSVVNVRG